METSPLTTGLAVLCAVLGVALWSATSKNRDEQRQGQSSKRASPSSSSSSSKNKKKKNSSSNNHVQKGLSASETNTDAGKVKALVTEKQSKRGKSKSSAARTPIESEAVASTGSSPKPPQEEALKALLQEKALDLHEVAHATSAEQNLSKSAPISGEQSAKKRKAKGKVPSNGVTKTNDERRAEMDAQRSAGHLDIGADMLDRDLEPETTYTRVATIPAPVLDSTPRSVPVEDGWHSVSGKSKASSKPSQPIRNVESADSNAWASSNPFAALPGSGAELPPSNRANGSVTNGQTKPVSSSVASTAPVRSIPGYSSSGTDAQTKKQRQNAAKAAAKKAAREGDEADRQARLSQHRRELEAERMREFYKKGGSGMPQPSSKWETVGQAKTLPKASINEKGSLVWD